MTTGSGDVGLSLEKYDKAYKAEPLLMSETMVGSETKDPNQKFIMVYDFNKNWTFMIELININREENPRLTYPSCIRSEGIAPSQYGTKGLISEKLAEVEEKYDLNSEALVNGFGTEGEDEEDTSTEDGEEDVEENKEEF